LDYIDNSDERRQFEAVWKRVTERSNATISDYLNLVPLDNSQQGHPVPAGHSPPADQLMPAANPPAEKYNSLYENPCPPTPIEEDCQLLSRLISEECFIICLYRLLFQRLKGGNCAGTLYRLYREGSESLKRLKAAYFLQTGQVFRAATCKPDGGSLAKVLHNLYWQEANTAEDFYNASSSVRSDKLSALLIKISAAKKSRANELEALIGALIS
jgi:hypothetical protein